MDWIVQDRPVRLNRIWAPWIPLVAVVDAAVVYAGGELALWARGAFAGPDWGGDLVLQWGQLSILMSIAFPLSMQILGFYRPVVEPFGRPRVWRRISAWSVLVLLLIAMMFATKSGHQYSRLWLGIWYAICLVLFGLEIRVFSVIQAWRVSRGFGVKRILLAGAGPLAQRTAELFERHAECGLSVVGYLSESDVADGLRDHSCLGPIEDVEKVVAAQSVDEVWITLPLSEQPRIQAILRDMREHLIDVRLVPDIFAYDLVNREVEEVLGLPVIGLITSPQRGLDLALKRLIDIAGSLAGIVIISPLLLACVAAIKLTSGGPVFFVQARHGLDGKAFLMYKLRTMMVQETKGSAYQQATRNDPRVTRIGRILRRYSLDELPQLFNVFIGDMSLVGPRPHPVDMNYENWGEIDRYALRHRVKPGITGWAQVHGFRGETRDKSLLRKRIEYDLYYIDSWSLALDIQILLRTFIVAWRQPMAY